MFRATQTVYLINTAHLKWLAIPHSGKHMVLYHGGLGKLELHFSLTVGLNKIWAMEGTPGHTSILLSQWATGHNSVSAGSQLVQKSGHTPKSM
jgi:hypothetical protein